MAKTDELGTGTNPEGHVPRTADELGDAATSERDEYAEVLTESTRASLETGDFISPAAEPGTGVG